MDKPNDPGKSGVKPAPPSEGTLPLGGEATTFNAPSNPFRGGDSFPEIPGYTFIGVLGRGAMGVVYEARQTSLNRAVAIKLLSSSLDSLIQRFELEAKALGRIRDDGIIQIFDVGTWKERPYIVMELVRGGTLGQAMMGHITDPHDAARLVVQMAKALGAAHAAGILHRDLKPGNVMLSQAPHPADSLGRVRFDGIHPKLGDFGLAKEMNEEASMGLTETGAVMGTPGYMAPEQALGCNRTLTPATDIHALGAILYELLTGNPPFRGESALETIRMVSDVDPIPPRRIRNGIPFDLETICLKCLHKSPSRRYQNTQELVDDLEAFLHHKTIMARRATRVERATKWCIRNPGMAASIGFSLAGLIVVISIGAFVASQKIRRDNENLVGLQENLGFERVRANDITKASIWFAAALAHETRTDRQLLARLRIGAMNDGFPWIRSYVVHEQAVKGAEWSPSGRLYLSFGDDRRIKVNDPTQFGKPTIQMTKLERSQTDPDGGILSARFLSEDRILILDEAGILYDWSWKDNQNPVILDREVTALTVAPARSLVGLGIGEKGLLLSVTGSNLNPTTIRQQLPKAVSLGEEIKDLAFLESGLGLVAQLDSGIKRISEKNEVIAYEELEGTITGLTVSSDGKKVAGGNSKGWVRVWNAGSTKPLSGRFGHREKILCLAFSSDGSMLATGSIDQRVSVREADTGNLKYQISHEGDVTCLAFSQDPPWLFTGSEDNTVRIWHADSGRPASSQLVYNATMRAVVPHPKASLLLGTSDDNTCCLWDLRLKNQISFRVGDSLDDFLTGLGKTGRILATRSDEKIRIGSTKPIEDAFENEKGRFLTFDEKAYVEQLKTLPVAAKGMSIAPGLGILVLGMDGSVSLWNEEGIKTEDILGPDPERKKALGISSSPKAKFFVLESPAKGHHKKLQVYWLKGTNKGKNLVIDHMEHVRCWAFSPEDDKLATGEGQGQLFISQLAITDPIRPVSCVGPIPAHDGGIASMAFSPDGQWVATGGEDMRIHMWNAMTGEPSSWKLSDAPQHASLVNSLTFDNQGKRILSGGEDNTLRQWHVSNGQAIGEPLLHNSSVTGSIHWKSPKTTYHLDLAASTTTEGGLYLWDLRYGELLAPVVTPAGYSLEGFDFLPVSGKDPVVILGCSLGTITALRLQSAPEWASPDQLREFAEYHPAFGLNKKGTNLLPISGYQIPELMEKVLRAFQKEYAPLPAPFLPSPPSLPKESSP